MDARVDTYSGDVVGKRHEQVAAFLTHGTGATELLAFNPALALFTIRAIRDGISGATPDSDDIRDLLTKKQRVICGALGLPGTNSTARTLRKLQAQDCSEEALDDLWTLLVEDEASQTLTHLPKLTPEALRILKSDCLRRIVSPAALRGMVTCEDDSFGNFTLKDFEVWERTEREAKAGPPLSGPCNSASDVYFRLAIAKLEHAPFPPPPLDLPDNFQAITSETGLAEEAKQQGNCVSGHAVLAQAGYNYFYQLLAPERATVWLGSNDGRWELKEIEGSRNTPVRPSTEEYVREVIERCQDDPVGAPPVPEVDLSIRSNLSDTGHIGSPPALDLPDSLEPLTSVARILQREGAPRDILLSWIPRIGFWGVYAYHLHQPVEATVILENTAGYTEVADGWQIAEIIPHADPVTWEVYDYVREVLEASQNHSEGSSVG